MGFLDMAIAGLHNVPTLESPVFRESQSSLSRRLGNQENVGTRASSILQMWRELEDECAVNRARERVRTRLNRESNDSLISPRSGLARGDLGNLSESENGSVINPESQIGQMNDREDRQSLISEESLDLGDVERERVRKIFREWMSSGENVETPRVARIIRSPRGQCGGENEIERVQVVSNWVQTTSHSRGVCVWSREDQVSENVSEVEHNGEVFNPNEGEIVTSRRQIRKLYGRQALLDLLAKKEQERRHELQCLEGTRPVSSFAHRNRIQSLLRLRCFQNRGSTEARRPTSPAENELGLLRQRQTVTGLREGLLSRLDNNAHVQESEVSLSSSENTPNAFRDDQSQANSSVDVLVINELNDPLTEVLNVAHEENEIRDNVDVAPSTTSPNIDSVVESVANLGHLQGRLDRDVDNSVISNGFSNYEIQHLSLQENPRTGSGQFTVLEERHENVHEQYSDIEEPNSRNELDDQVGVIVNDNGLESDVPEEEEQVYEGEWESPFSDQWRDDDVERDRLDLLDEREDYSHGGLESEDEAQIDMQEDYWHENGSQETPRDWLGMNADSRSAPNRVDTFYFSDDDNVHHIELRELVNRRRVSSLLHSDFRESLDQIIQSYAERQANVPDDWELHEMLPPPFIPRNQAQLYTDQEDTRAYRSEPPPPPPLPPQAHRGQRTHQTNWTTRELRQQPGMEWEIINDLRIDMARLQERLNNMQRLLETCMDMQIELQRSVKLEVSAALSRSLNQSELLGNSLREDNLKWDNVRKGVCCICSNTNIDSLLYRCGHMCTCTKCAEILVQDNGKCPMCQAPVIEVIRAYFIQ